MTSFIPCGTTSAFASVLMAALLLTASPTSGIDPLILTSEALCFETYSVAPLAAFTVTNVNDSGSGSLREALQNANNNGGPDTISFNISGAGVHTITLSSGLPGQNQPVVIDGTTQPGFTGTPLIEINGNGVGGDGLVLLGGNSTVRSLIINRFNGNGIAIQNTGSNVIAGNYIGTDATGALARPNGQNGILILGAPNNTIGGTTAADRNVISGNGLTGVVVQNSSSIGNQVRGNYIGTDKSGTAALGNGGRGIFIDAPNNTIGGGDNGAGNIISGNAQSGVLIVNGGSTNNRIQGNFIGTNAQGDAALPNEFGVIIGDRIDQLRGTGSCFVGTDGNNVTDASEGNLISGNTFDGIVLVSGGTTSNRIAGNRIGTNLAGTSALPNGGNGVLIERDAGGNFVGTNGDGVSDPLEGNIISGNSGDGVAITENGSTNNRLLSNSIFSNAGLGIDLANNGVTPNDNGDSDNGPNNLQNFPVLTSVSSATGVQGTLNSTPNTTFRIEVFSNAAADPSGFGEGHSFVGAVSTLTDGAGNATFTLATALTGGQFITATATGPNSGTSEFSAAIMVALPSITISVNDAQSNEPLSSFTPMLFTVVLSAPAPGAGITVHYATSDQSAMAGSDYTAIPDTVLTFLAGERLKTVSVNILADKDSDEVEETFQLNLMNAIGANIAQGQAIGTIKEGSSAPASLMVSELRSSGPAGPGDDFVELYNNTDAPLTIAALDDSPGYGVFNLGANCNATPLLIATIPNGTVIPPRGHYLLVGSTYSLNDNAAGDQKLSLDVESDGNLAIFTTTNVGNLSTLTRLDAVGFVDTDNNCALLSEGATLGTSPPESEHSWVRRFPGGCTGTNPNGASNNCTTPTMVQNTLPQTVGRPQDTNDNLLDFLFVSTDGSPGQTADRQRLGAPGPENLSSPIIRGTPNGSGTINPSLVDPAQSASVAPNRERVPCATPGTCGANQTFGTLDIRRRFTNNTGVSVTRLRFRIMDISTFPNGPGIADLRALTSSTVIVTVTGGAMVTVNGTTLEEDTGPPNQGLQMGGGYNSTLSAGVVTLAAPLPPGGSVNLRFVFGVENLGKFRVFLMTEALP